MATWETRDLGTGRGTCASCGREADLKLTESSYRRTWRDALTGSADHRVDRRVHCSACGAVYPVRATDGVPIDLAMRRSSSSRPGAHRRRRTTDPPARP